MATPSVTKKSELNISTLTLETTPTSAPVDPTTKDSIESLQDKPSQEQDKASSDRSCLTWCADQICHFFSAICRFLCNLCGSSTKPTPSVSKEPQPSEPDSSSTSSAGNETTAADQTTDAQPSETGMSSEPKAEPTPPPPEQQGARQLPTSAEWANKVLKKYEKNHTDAALNYKRLLDKGHFKTFRTEYSTQQQLEFMYALTDTGTEPQRSHITRTTLNTYSASMKSDKYTEMDDLQLLGLAASGNPVAAMHHYIGRLLFERPLAASILEKAPVPIGTDSAPASVSNSAVEKAKEVPRLLTETEWANKLLEAYEAIYTKDPSKIEFGCFYAGLRGIQYCTPFFNKYTTRQQLQFLHALTNGTIHPARFSIDRITLGNFATRIKSDKYTTVDTNALGNWTSDKSPDDMRKAVVQLHNTIEGILIPGSNWV